MHTHYHKQKPNIIVIDQHEDEIINKCITQTRNYLFLLLRLKWCSELWVHTEIDVQYWELKNYWLFE